MLNLFCNRSLKSFLFLAILLFVFPCIARGDGWRKIGEAAGNIKSIKAEFIQEKHMKILKTPIISKGVFLFQAPGSLRWEYKSPVKSVLLMHNGGTKRYIKKKGVIIEDSGMSLEAMQFVMQEITGWLAGKFDNNPSFEAELKQGNRIVMTPKSESFSMMIEKIEIILSHRPGVIDSVMIYENGESYTQLKFVEPVLNEKLEDSLFRNL
ncbi:MAG: outer membrane lipoprotein carrier protein LolA [Deltaproteobacteria bacterium]|nr:outer membrane lipoprotein carrier protein LolA [Deltaproteobacteria bacterium]